MMKLAPPLPQAVLIALKRGLIAARIYVQDCAARARRGGDADLAERLRDITECIANELDYIERQMEK